MVPQPCHMLFQIGHRDDALPLAHVAVAVEGPGWANPDNVTLQVANAIIGHYDCTYGGGRVSGHGALPSEKRGFWDCVLSYCGVQGTGTDRRVALTVLTRGSTCPAHWLQSL